MKWTWKYFEQFSPLELYAVLRLRSEIFVLEQNCVYLDCDGADPICEHLLGFDAAGELVAYLRLVPGGGKFAEKSLGRVLTAPGVRGTGAGRALLAEGIRRAAGAPLRIAAQKYLEKFYADFGFVSVGAEYLEDGILHIDMVRA